MGDKLDEGCVQADEGETVQGPARRQSSPLGWMIPLRPGFAVIPVSRPPSFA